MRVLVLGSGGREHALVASLAADPIVSAVVAAPGNPGMVSAATLRVADAVRAAGVTCFGPSASAARLEGSKAFAKEVMAAAGVPTAASLVASSQAEAEVALKTFGPPYVVKDDGLAAGKGVVVTDDYDAALAHAVHCGRAVIEEYLDGPEVSVFVVCDGVTAVPLLPAQDFKRARDGDEGPNTGGMGAYAPLPWTPAELVPTVMSTVVSPVIEEMSRRGTPFSGLLYCGLALTSHGVKVVEFNTRFGDPETQVVLPLLGSSLAELLYASATGSLADLPPLWWRPGAAVTVVIASEGYPEAPRTGDVITGAEGGGFLHAGTRQLPDGTLVTAGGRVLCCTATGPTVAQARERAYEMVSHVRFAGATFRTDIAAGY
jgi:phosphoribosylamine--glycine ligase